MSDKPNVYVNPKAPEGLKRMLREMFPEANNLTDEQMEALIERATIARGGPIDE
jgi:hypothetical protein